MKPKKNPQDATLRNIRALKKRVERLEKELEAVKGYLIRNGDFMWLPEALEPKRSKRK